MSSARRLPQYQDNAQTDRRCDSGGIARDPITELKARSDHHFTSSHHSHHPGEAHREHGPVVSRHFRPELLLFSNSVPKSSEAEFNQERANIQ